MIPLTVKPVAVFDMDGLLTNFVGAALKVHGVDEFALRRATKYEFWELLHLTLDAFWEPLLNEEFWATLPPLEDGLALLDDARVMADKGHFELCLLTSSAPKGAKEGKRRWLQRHAPDMVGRTFYADGPKWLMGGPHKLLIDDHEPTCEKWVKLGGGRAALVPRPWNSARDSCLSHPDPLRDGHDFDHAIDFGSAWLHELDHAENAFNPAFECVMCGKPPLPQEEVFP